MIAKAGASMEVDLKRLQRIVVGALLGILLSTTAQAATSPVEMLRELFRRPETEWKQILTQSRSLLDQQFFENVEKRIRWGIENNHIDDAFRFAMVGDFASEVRNRPANFRIDLAELFFQAQNLTMAGQIVDNIMVTSPGTEPGKQAMFLKARMLEMQRDVFRAHEFYVELAKLGYRAGESWYKAGQISMAIQQESRAEKEWENAQKAGNLEAGIALEQYRRQAKGDWVDAFPPVENRPDIDTTTGIEPKAPELEEDYLFAADLALQEGELDTARAKLNAAYEKSPKDLDVVRRMGALLYRMGHLEEARAFLDTALADAPQDVELLRTRANTEERLFDRSKKPDHLERALADYSKAVRLQPNHQFLTIEYQRAQEKKS